MVEVLCSPLLGAVSHGFLGRRTGVSEGVVCGLNVGFGAVGEGGDTLAAVQENRARALAAVAPGTRLVTVWQVHSAVCVEAGDWDEEARPEADALVTNKSGITLGILTADCAPVLFADPQAGVIGAAHAGWKGAFAGVCEATLDAMVALGARRDHIAAAVGPAIAQASYEVDDLFHERFLAESRDHAARFVPGRSGHWHFDLAGYVAGRLRRAGLEKVDTLCADTCREEKRFFSYRRSTLRGEAAYGRQLSLITNNTNGRRA